MQIKNLDEYKAAYGKSVAEPEKFWADVAEHFQWKSKWKEVLKWDFEGPDVKWFLNAKLNITENCIDRHLHNKKDKVAFIFEANDPSASNRKITYEELSHEVCRLGNLLRELGVKKGDRVCIYLPMVPEAVYAM